MKIVYDDEHTGRFVDPASIDFMILVAAELENALRQGDIGQEAKRREIVETFMHDFGYMLDMKWIKHQGIRVYPVLCFAEKAGYSEPIDVLHVPQWTCHHEYVPGNVETVYEQPEEVEKIIVSDSSEDIYD